MPDSTTTSGGDVDGDLRAGLAELSLLATSRMDLSDALTRVAEFAVSAIPGAAGAGITLLEADRPDTVVASAPFVSQVDAIQYELGEGPCIAAAAQGRTVRSGSIADDPAWGRFGARAARLGVYSVLSIPLVTGAGILGAMNLYAHRRSAFDERAAAVGELFAVPAAIVVENAQVLAQATRLTVQLQAALATRPTIDHALGIIMSRIGCDPSQAFTRLRAISQRENRKLNVVAQQIVDDAIRSARSRRPLQG